MKLESLELKLCDIQGRLFELSLAAGYDSERFVSCFMKSRTARALDSRYNRMQWAGEEYLLEEIGEEAELTKGNNTISAEVMYWMGYIYRYWHYLKDETSANIYTQADFRTMKRNYLMFHTMGPALAIDDLIEIRRQKRKHKMD